MIAIIVDGGLEGTRYVQVSDPNQESLVTVAVVRRVTNDFTTFIDFSIRSITTTYPLYGDWPESGARHLPTVTQVTVR